MPAANIHSDLLLRVRPRPRGKKQHKEGEIPANAISGYGSVGSEATCFAAATNVGLCLKTYERIIQTHPSGLPVVMVIKFSNLSVNSINSVNSANFCSF